MMEFNLKGKIKTGQVKFFGKNLISSHFPIIKDGTLILPNQFNFNSNWSFQHKCLSCSNTVSIKEDFDDNSKNFNIISNLNSLNYSALLINKISSLFSILRYVEIDNVSYLNRNDFNYTFEFQKKTSIHLTNYICNKCSANYLGIINIGYPLPPEKGLTQGRLGQVNLVEIIGIENNISSLLVAERTKQT